MIIKSSSIGIGFATAFLSYTEIRSEIFHLTTALFVLLSHNYHEMQQSVSFMKYAVNRLCKANESTKTN